MSVATVNPDLRRAVIDAGTHIVEEHGAAALTARKVTAAANTSTIAIYRLFGGMPGLLDALADEAFTRFSRCLAEVPTTEDPVADVFALGAAYRQYALANGQRYQLMFGASTPASGRTDLTVTGHMTDRPQRAGAFDELLDAVRRMIDLDRIVGNDGDSSQIAGRLWSALHGAVTLELAGFFGELDNGLTHVLAPMTIDLLVGMGADRSQTADSLAKAAARRNGSG